MLYILAAKKCWCPLKNEKERKKERERGKIVARRAQRKKRREEQIKGRKLRVIEKKSKGGNKEEKENR